MNRLMENQWQWVEPSHMLRDGVLEQLTDGDLSFSPGGQNMTFGALFREMGEIEKAYLNSFKNFKQDFSYRNTEAGLDTSIAQLRAWFQKLDAELKDTIAAFSDDDLKKTIERGSGFSMPVDTQLEVYLQALLIFLGKATIFLRAMNKPLPENVQQWIG